MMPEISVETSQTDLVHNSGAIAGSVARIRDTMAVARFRTKLQLLVKSGRIESWRRQGCICRSTALHGRTRSFHVYTDMPINQEERDMGVAGWSADVV